jgi:hypothetical protein
MSHNRDSRERFNERSSRQPRLDIPSQPPSRSPSPKPCLKHPGTRPKGGKPAGPPVQFATMDDVREMAPAERAAGSDRAMWDNAAKRARSRNMWRELGDYDYKVKG